MDQNIGKMLNDRYELLDVLGVGGMAVVYKAMCHRLNRLVAVKVLKPELAADASIRARFHDESKAVGMMSHKNIVNVFDVNQDGDIDYFVMELVDGITLKQYIHRRGGVLNWREALHFSVQILQGLDHAHSRGIIHRDVKPQNIMVLRDGSVKVADFGIATIADAQKTVTQEALGSVHYISPEQAKGSSVDARSDIYSTGVVLYEMLTGRLPYEGDSPVAVAIQHINSIPLAPRELNPDIPVGMEQITMKAMAQDRELRYANAEAMLADLETFRKKPNTVFEYQNPWMLTELKDVKPYEPEKTEQNQPPEPEEPEEDEDKRRRRNLVLVGGAVAAILLVVFFIFRLLFTSFLSGVLDGGTEYTVPELLGKTYTEAQEMVFTNPELNGHFRIVESEEKAYNASYEPGQIIAQDPMGGSITKSEETEIVVVLCSDQESEEETELIMPDIVGQDYAGWADTLNEKYGVVVRYSSTYSDEYDKGLIISTSPVAGTVLTAGQTVDVTYSKGAKDTSVVMVSLIGMTENEAKAALEKLGLKCGTVVTVSSDQPAGVVVFQSVKAKAEVEPGSSVDLQVSSGPQPEDPEPEPEPDPEPEPNTEDDNGTNNTAQEDELHVITVNMPDKRSTFSSVSIKINGVNYYSGTVGADQSSFSVEYHGTIESIDVTVDGATHKDFSIS